MSNITIEKVEGSFCGEGLKLADWDCPETLKAELDKMEVGAQGWLMLPMPLANKPDYKHDFHFRVLKAGPRFSNATWTEGDVAYAAKHIGEELAKIMTR